MLEILRRKLWETIYLNPVIPKELYANEKDPDYISIESLNSMTGKTVKLMFKDNTQIVTAIYEFDKNDYLEKVIFIEKNSESVVFDRQTQIKEILMEISQFKSSAVKPRNLSIA